MDLCYLTLCRFNNLYFYCFLSLVFINLFIKNQSKLLFINKKLFKLMTKIARNQTELNFTNTLECEGVGFCGIGMNHTRMCVFRNR